MLTMLAIENAECLCVEIGIWNISTSVALDDSEDLAFKISAAGVLWPSYSEQIDRVIAASILNSTGRQTSWAISAFEAWFEVRQEVAGIVLSMAQ